jgi:hypothetical protein
MPSPNLLRTDYITETAQHAVDAPKNALQQQGMEQMNQIRGHAIQQFKFKDEAEFLTFYNDEIKPNLELEYLDETLESLRGMGAELPSVQGEAWYHEEAKRTGRKAEDIFMEHKQGFDKTVDDRRKQLAYEADEKRKADRALAEQKRKDDAAIQAERRAQEKFMASEKRASEKHKRELSEMKKKTDDAKDTGKIKASDTNSIGRIIERELNIEWDEDRGVYLGATKQERKQATLVHATAEYFFLVEGLSHAQAVLKAQRHIEESMGQTEKQAEQKKKSWKQYQTKKTTQPNNVLQKAH